MRASVRIWLLLGVALSGACTKDFSRFQFRDAPNTKPDLRGGAPGSSAGSGGSEGVLGRNQIAGASGKAAAGANGAGRGAIIRMDGDAGVSARGGMSAAQGGSSAGRKALAPMDEDAGMHPDAQMPMDASLPRVDASQPPVDAGPTVEQQCTTSAARELADLASGCTSCACGACAASVLPCLEQGDSVYERPCRDLLKCAVSHGCHDWDCYCSTPDCRADDADQGDGPCVEEMNAAAGTSRDRAAVNAAHAEKDPSNPLTMAIKATTCMLGSEHGSVSGACETTCDVR